MEPTTNISRLLPGFSSHLQAQIEQASQQVNLTQQSQVPGSPANHSHQSSHSHHQQHQQQHQQQQFVNPGRGRGRGQRRGPWRGQGRLENHLASGQHREGFTSYAPEPSNSQAFPPLGSVQTNNRHYNTSSQDRLGPGPAPPQTLTQNIPPQTFEQHHASLNQPQDFFQRARAGAYRGHVARMQYPQSHHRLGNQTATPSTGPSVASSNYSRPRARNRNLYESFSNPDQQYLHERVQLQHHFLMAVASIALQTALTPAEGREKDAFRLELENVAQAAVAGHAKSTISLVDSKKVKLKCYGSLASGFAVGGSDLDLLLMLPQELGPTGSIETDLQRVLERAFLDAGYGARLLTKTRVPILRVCQKPASDLLESLRQTRRKWEEEEEQAENDEESKLHHPDYSRLPEATDKQLVAAAKAFSELELSPTDVPLPPSPVHERAHLEYTGDVGILCDINFSNYVAIHNTTLLRCYCKCDPRVREMGIFVKTWARARKINTPYYGTLSSYGYILMVLHYLMNVAKPPVIPNLQHRARDADAWAGKTEVELFEGFDIRFDNNELKIEHAAKAGQITENKQSLGALLHGFFWYYSDRQGFHWINEVISIRTVGGILTKQSKGWTEGKRGGENNQIRLRYLLAIEDPFEIEHNIARTVGHSGVGAIRDEFHRAWDIIGKARLTNGGEWKWRMADGTIGEDLLEKAEDRGDLLKRDQEYHWNKLQEMRAAFAARKEREGAAKAEGAVMADQEVGKGETAESGMLSASMPSPTQTYEGGLSTDPSNSQLIQQSRNQSTQPPTMGRRRRVRTDSNSSDDKAARSSPESSFGIARVSLQSTAKATSGAEHETDVKSANEPQELTEQTADSCEPYANAEQAKVSMVLRLEDVCVRPGSFGDERPLAWNTNTRAGRWLHWRDQKIRRGDWDPQRLLLGQFNTFHYLFPYDASRPVSVPSKRSQQRNDRLREKSMSHFNRDSVTPEKSMKSTELASPRSRDISYSLQTSDQPIVMAVEPPRKDSAISGITALYPDTSIPATSATRRPRKKSGSQKQLVRPSSEVPTMTTGKTYSVDTVEPVSGPMQNGSDMSLRPRDEDPNIMPVPPRVGFKFDPRQLRDLAIIREGGNGCARGGDEWNVEIDGEWGGGGIMGGALKTSSGLITTPVGIGGDGDGWEYGKGDEEGLLGELPTIGTIEA